MLRVQVAIIAALAASTLAHPDPANLQELECAVSALATTFGAAKFPAGMLRFND